MAEITHRTVEANGIRIHLAEAGEGPLVLLCHGWPESWYSWRHQLEALAEAGYRAVAPDMRGYGETDRPEAIEGYTMLSSGRRHGRRCSTRSASTGRSIVGHDWGAPVAWHAALLRPDRFRAVAGLSVPFRPRGLGRPTTVMPQTEKSWFYQLYFQEPGRRRGRTRARPARLDPAPALFRLGRRSATPPVDAPGDAAPGMVPRDGGILSRHDRSGPAAAVAHRGGHRRLSRTHSPATGFRGGLNWYRNIDRNWGLMAPFAGLKVTVPALYVAGDRDLVVGFTGAGELIASLKQHVPDLRDIVMLPGCGHWTQQERPDEVNALLLRFLRGLS